MREFDRIMSDIGWPPIYLVSEVQMASVEPKSGRLAGADGMASDWHPIITVRRGMSGKYLRNVLWHEIAHHLFPHRTHWWVEAFAERMARGGGMGDNCRKFGHSVDDLPDRERLLVLARRASERLKAKWAARTMPERLNG